MLRIRRYPSGSGFKDNSNLDRLFHKEKGYVYMNKELKRNKLTRRMMITGGLLAIISLTGAFFWSLGFTLIHPAIYIMGIIMGTGWFCTACASIERR